MHVLDWPICSPGLNITENVWKYVARNIYKDGRRFKTKEELGTAVFESFMNISMNYIKNLYHSMTRRCISVVERKEAMVDY